MIIVKAPLRISLGGGGTDLPSYYERYGSTFLSAAIDKYIYLSLHETFAENIILKYSEMEKVGTVDKIKHPIIREALKMTGVENSIEISSFADIPSGTGLGSSGTFTVALLKALYTYTQHFHTALSLAEDACDIEINKLGAPIGKQDQYISSVGGLTRFEINTHGQVTANPLRIDRDVHTELEEHLLLFFTGYSRSANDILKEQNDQTITELNTANSEKLVDPSEEMIQNLHFVKDLGTKSWEAIEKGDLNEFANLMNVHWEHKKKRSKQMSNGRIDEWYQLALQNGALGGKLIGAGGGGFLMFLAEDKRKLRRVMKEAGLRDVPFRFDELGAQVVLRD